MVKEKEVVIKSDFIPMESLRVTVSLDRYEALVMLETRVKVLIEQARAENSIGLIELYRTLGYTQDADREQKRREMEHEKWKLEYEEALRGEAEEGAEI